MNAPDFWGGTALTAAAVSGEAEITDLLLQRGADPNVSDDGASPLGYALYGLATSKTPSEIARFARVVKLLKEAGA